MLFDVTGCQVVPARLDGAGPVTPVWLARAIRTRAKPCVSSVLWVMGGTRTTDDRTSRAAKPTHEVLGVSAATRAAGASCSVPVRPRLSERERAGRPDQRLAGSGQCVADSVQYGEVPADGRGVVTGAHLLMVEREMDDAVGVRGRLGQVVQVIEVTPVHARAERGHGRRGGVGSRQAHDVVPGGDELRDDGRGRGDRTHR